MSLSDYVEHYSEMTLRVLVLRLCVISGPVLISNFIWKLLRVGNGSPGHMIYMAVMAKYDLTLYKSYSPEPEGQ